ncbi:hypothetical protein [Actinomadura terrae]|uniref:hypothetical protein n=1 Tax=Actinomadura terrae TaxID=604353 RepID=UPI001FA6AEBA|nr:hypothetical protein [Actinomadura terrae]
MAHYVSVAECNRAGRSFEKLLGSNYDCRVRRVRSTFAPAGRGTSPAGRPIMSNLISRITRLVTPDHGLFGFYDEGGRYPEIRVTDITWFAANEGEVLISPAQDLVKQGMQFEHWASKPNLADNEAEREATFPFHVTYGSIGLNFIAGGSEPDVFAIPPGRYDVHLSGHHLTRVVHSVEEMYQRYDDYDDPEFASSRDALLGEELYIARFWPLQS